MKIQLTLFALLSGAISVFSQTQKLNRIEYSESTPTSYESRENLFYVGEEVFVTIEEDGKRVVFLGYNKESKRKAFKIPAKATLKYKKDALDLYNEWVSGDTLILMYMGIGKNTTLTHFVYYGLDGKPIKNRMKPMITQLDKSLKRLEYDVLISENKKYIAHRTYYETKANDDKDEVTLSVTVYDSKTREMVSQSTHVYPVHFNDVELVSERVSNSGRYYALDLDPKSDFFAVVTAKGDDFVHKELTFPNWRVLGLSLVEKQAQSMGLVGFYSETGYETEGIFFMPIDDALDMNVQSEIVFDEEMLELNEEEIFPEAVIFKGGYPDGQGGTFFVFDQYEEVDVNKHNYGDITLGDDVYLDVYNPFIVVHQNAEGDIDWHENIIKMGETNQNASHINGKGGFMVYEDHIKFYVNQWDTEDFTDSDDVLDWIDEDRNNAIYTEVTLTADGEKTIQVFWVEEVRKSRHYVNDLSGFSLNYDPEQIILLREAKQKYDAPIIFVEFDITSMDEIEYVEEDY
jgi:hypothetical protein